ncbi:MAG: hypothetical protein E7583_08375 [Ruminococcaceae bacterium]|nr:hypothetical protein [Oscillospiraceae bacterium]
MRIIAHRSGPVNYPEQTVLSALDAIRMGAEMVEVDVRFTKNGDLAIHHDDRADYLFGDERNIPEMTTTEFLSLRHKRNPEFCSHLLDHYMAAGAFPLLIHIKDEKTIPKILELSERYGCTDKITLGVLTADGVRNAKRIIPDVKVLVFMGSPENTDECVEAGADYIRLWEDWFTKENVARVKKHSGVELWCMAGKCTPEGVGYTTKENVERFVRMGADGILVNDVSFLIDTLKELRIQ